MHLSMRQINAKILNSGSPAPVIIIFVFPWNMSAYMSKASSYKCKYDTCRQITRKSLRRNTRTIYSKVSSGGIIIIAREKVASVFQYNLICIAIKIKRLIMFTYQVYIETVLRMLPTYIKGDQFLFLRQEQKFPCACRRLVKKSNHTIEVMWL